LDDDLDSAAPTRSQPRSAGRAFPFSAVCRVSAREIGQLESCAANSARPSGTTFQGGALLDFSYDAAKEIN
jgi:hypothetical protein